VAPCSDHEQQQEEVSKGVEQSRAARPQLVQPESVPPQPNGRFPQSRRIRKRREYVAVQAGARRVVTAHFVILLQAQSEPGGAPRLGITASRKVGNAVIRNRAKRLVREAFRATQSLWPFGMDLVIIVRSLREGTQLADVTREWCAAASAIASRARELRSKRGDAQ
jgi:ribonuclease P protein component